MSDKTDPWRDYKTDPPPQEAGIYQWRVPTKNFTVIFVDKMRWRGNGYRDSFYSPRFDHWDGYKVTVPPCDWQPYEGEAKPRTILGLEGHDINTCSRCKQVPVLTGFRKSFDGGTYLLAEPHKFNTWRLKCCGWSSTPHLNDPVSLINGWNECNRPYAGLVEAARIALLTGLLDEAPAIVRRLETALAKAEGRS